MRFILAIALSFLACPLYADEFELPYSLGNNWGEFHPENTLQFTFNDRVGGLTVTGRRLIYEFPVGHIYRWGHGVPGGESSRRVTLNHGIYTDPYGNIQFHPTTHTQDEWYSGRQLGPEHLTASISEITRSTRRRLISVLQQAQGRREPFPGYNGGQAGITDNTTYPLNRTYCGFDLYEYTNARDPWIEERRPDKFPYSEARVFAWPAGSGEQYQLAFECSVNCVVDAELVGWLHTTYLFDHETLCEIPQIIEAHQDWLEGHIVELQSEILNPDFIER